MEMKIQYILPESEILQKHIAYYFTFDFPGTNPSKELLGYPNHLHLVTIYKNFSPTFSNNCYTFQENNKLTVDITGRFTQPLTHQLTVPMKGISIVFKPLGINYFCNKSLSEVVPNIWAEFPFWNVKATELEELLDLQDVSQVHERLDTILLSLYRPFENQILTETLSLLHNNYADFKVNQVAEKLKVSRKTLFRQFQKHLGVSINDYRRILRFRDAIKLHQGKDENLTKIAYETYFCDQSHFIKEINKLTGETPKKIFKESEFVKGAPFFIKIR
jgi:AraC-like DNA-binding protein